MGAKITNGLFSTLCVQFCSPFNNNIYVTFRRISYLIFFFFVSFSLRFAHNNVAHAHALSLNRALKKNVNLHFVGRPVFIPGYNISTFEPFIIILLKFYDITSLITLAGVFSLPSIYL